jgi:hypothetical protein
MTAADDDWIRWIGGPSAQPAPAQPQPEPAPPPGKIPAGPRGPVVAQPADFIRAIARGSRRNVYLEGNRR